MFGGNGSQSLRTTTQKNEVIKNRRKTSNRNHKTIRWKGCLRLKDKGDRSGLEHDGSREWETFWLNWGDARVASETFVRAVFSSVCWLYPHIECHSVTRWSLRIVLIFTTVHIMTSTIHNSRILGSPPDRLLFWAWKWTRKMLTEGQSLWLSLPIPSSPASPSPILLSPELKHEARRSRPRLASLAQSTARQTREDPSGLWSACLTSKGECRGTSARWRGTESVKTCAETIWRGAQLVYIAEDEDEEVRRETAVPNCQCASSRTTHRGEMRITKWQAAVLPDTTTPLLQN